MKTSYAKYFLGVLIVYVFTLSVMACPPCWPVCDTTCQRCVDGECQPKPNTCNNCTNYITGPGTCRPDGTYCIGSKLQKGSISQPSNGASVRSNSSLSLSASAGSDSDCRNYTDSCGNSCSQSQNDPVTVSWSASAGTFPSGNTGTSVQWQSPSGSGEVSITASWANTNSDKFPEGGESQTITVKVVVPVPPEDPNNPTNQTNGAKAESKAPSTDPVTLTGEFNCYARDMVIKGRAMDVVIERNYRSDANDGVGGWRFGYSWDMSYNIKVRPLSDPGMIRLFDGTNRPIIYQRVAGSNPETYLPPAGRYDRIVKNGNGTYTLTEKDGREYKFNTHNDIERIEDRNGNAITFGYDGSYQLTSITDDLDRTITLSYDSVSGLLSTITDFADRTWTYNYDLSNNLTSVTAPATDDYPQGHTTTYGYSGHNLTTITDPNGQTWLSNTYTDNKVSNQVYGTGTSNLVFHPDDNYTTTTTRTEHVIDSIYNSAGLVTQETVYTEGLRAGDPASYVTQYQYDSNSELIRTTFPAGNYITYAYDPNGNVTCIAKEPNNDDPNIVTRFTYEPAYNQVASITDPRGNETTFDYDSNGNLETITYPEVETPSGSETPIVRFIYNSYGQVETITDPNGLVTRFEYYPTAAATGKGQLWRVRVDPNNVDITTVYEYDARNNVTKITDDGGAQYSFGYNELDQRISATDPNNVTAAFKYNPNRMLEEIRRPIADANQITAYAYDLLDKVKTITDPLGYTTRYGFDAEHAVADANDAEANNTHYDYDERGLLWKVTDANDGVTEYSYTPNGDIYTIADASDNVTTYEYDGFDRLKRVTYADDSDEEYGYDASGNLTSFTNRAGQTITFGYDALNRLIDKKRPGEPNIVSCYDLAGRVKYITQDTSGMVFDHDRLGRLESVTDQNNKAVSYQYDNLNRRTRLFYPDDTYIAYEYDVAGRLEYIKDQAGYPIVRYYYDSLSRITNVEYYRSGSSVGSMAYDYQDKYDPNMPSENNLGDRIERIDYCCNPSHSINYTYDNVGNATEVDVGGNYGWVFGYDNIYQTTSADQGSATNRAIDWQYDSVYNRTYFNDSSTGSLTYADNDINQYIQIGSTAPTYDPRGNLADDGTYTYQFDSENRLIKTGWSEDYGVPYICIYTYDLLGRRNSKARFYQHYPDQYVYDGPHIIAEYDGYGFLTKKYIYGPGIDNPAAMINVSGTSETWYYYYKDALGSIRLLTNTSGAVVESYTYDPYGKPRVMTSAGNDGNWLTEDVTPLYNASAIGNRFMFTGREWESDTGLYYYRFRDYSPTLGRFLQPDPIGYADSMNLYQYCGNNPVNWSDPLGLSTARIWLTDGTKITLIDPTIDEFRNAVASQKNSSIKKIQITGHGNSENMLIEHGYFGEGLELQNGQVVYTDTRKSFANGVKNKLAKDANIELDGCNTAYKGGWFSNKNNISKQLSNELPGVTVKGNRGVGVGNELFGWKPKGWETHVGGFGRTYKNGHEQ